MEKIEYPKVKNNLEENSYLYESEPFIDVDGFREYDMRWLYPKQINLFGFKILGIVLSDFFIKKSYNKIILGHDYRSYSSAIKYSLANGLITGGLEVIDIGLCTTPMAYFAQGHNKECGVVMITASHNENGWTGLKIGYKFPQTLIPNEIQSIKEATYKKINIIAKSGSLYYQKNILDEYIKSFNNKEKFKRKIRAVVACGNGTAGIVAPIILKNLGLDVIELHCDLDHNFPNYNPNPEDIKMLKDLSKSVLKNNADIGLAFDGDCDRCGVIDNDGEIIFADKMGLLIARNLSTKHKGSKFVVDIKSTNLFSTDSILKKNNASVDYWKTGHSHMKKYCLDYNAIAGFEKSGHYFFNKPLESGYDDGILSSYYILKVLEEKKDLSLSEIKKDLRTSWTTPTINAYCPDKIKYEVVKRMKNHLDMIKNTNQKIISERIKKIITINGVRFELTDMTWGLIRASSNKPEIVIVVESFKSFEIMQNLTAFILDWLREQKEVGEISNHI
ncbi:MAG: phosphomannomutase/phosphoglucomutase [Hyphomicrobiales bacterium]|nr:phosphomannomutase/phosphoglucomutase [Hyphomicrobiales bacterium]